MSRILAGKEFFMKKILAFVMVLSLAVICLSSCGASLKGKWMFDENGAEFVFDKNGTVSVSITVLGQTYDLGDGKYSAKKGELTISEFSFADLGSISDDTVRETVSAFIGNFVKEFSNSKYVIEKNLLTLTSSGKNTAVFEKR